MSYLHTLMDEVAVGKKEHLSLDEGRSTTELLGSVIPEAGIEPATSPRGASDYLLTFTSDVLRLLGDTLLSDAKKSIPEVSHGLPSADIKAEAEFAQSLYLKWGTGLVCYGTARTHDPGSPCTEARRPSPILFRYFDPVRT